MSGALAKRIEALELRANLGSVLQHQRAIACFARGGPSTAADHALIAAAARGNGDRPRLVRRLLAIAADLPPRTTNGA